MTDIPYPLTLGLHSQTDIVAAANDLHARLSAIEAIWSAHSRSHDSGDTQVVDRIERLEQHAMGAMRRARKAEDELASILRPNTKDQRAGHPAPMNPVVWLSIFYGHCRDCRHYNTCNLSQLPEGGCVNWEKPC